MTSEEMMRAIVDNGARIEENERLVFESGRARGTDEGYANGEQAEYDRFWNAFQKNKGNAHGYSASFGNSWTAETLKPKYDVVVRAGMYMFAWNVIGGDLVEYFARIGRKLDFSQAVNMNSAFYASRFTRVGKVYCDGLNFLNMFYGCTELETIDEWGTFDESKTIGGSAGENAFKDCSALKNITVRGIISGYINLKWSTQLSNASIRSFVGHLSDETTGMGLILSKTAVENAFEGGSTGAEWLNLIATKPNWIFSLV